MYLEFSMGKTSSTASFAVHLRIMALTSYEGPVILNTGPLVPCNMSHHS